MIASRKVDFLWPGRIPLGRITLLVGRPGEGKSFFTTDAAARVTTGTPWPDGAICPIGDVLMIVGEDDPADTVRPRCDAHHADVERIHLLSMVRKQDDDGKVFEIAFTLENIPALEMAARQLPELKLLIVDPIGSYIGGRVDSHRDNEVRAILAPLAKLAEQYGFAVLIVAHRRKAGGDVADDLALGSRAFTGIARAVWHLSRDRQNRARRLLLPGKNNLAAEGTGLAFSIVGDPPALAWEHAPVTMSADDALADEQDGPGRPANERAEAIEWLKAELADLQEHAVDDLKKAATAAGLASWRTVRRAGTEIGVIRRRAQFGGGWTWRISASVLSGQNSGQRDRIPLTQTFCPPGQIGESQREGDKIILPGQNYSSPARAHASTHSQNPEKVGAQ